MESKFSSNYHTFVSILFFLVAWKLAGVAETGDNIWLAPTIIIAIAGLLTGIEGVTSAISQTSPFPGRAGQWLWTLRPRGWLIAWATIMLVNSLWGTPHILFQYGPRTCIYVGWQGAVRLTTDGDGVFNGCRLFKGISQGLTRPEGR